MIQNPSRLSSAGACLKSSLKPEEMPVKVWGGQRFLPLRTAINAETLLNKAGVYGDRKAGDPIEDDYLRLILTDGTIEPTL